MERYKYKVPSRSFCSDYCPKLSPFVDYNKPLWFECNLNVMPQIKFFMGNEDSCFVVTRKGKNNGGNKDCIQKVASYLARSKKSGTKLVYITHGYKSEAKWMMEMQNSLQKRYRNSNIVVGLVYWKHGARGSWVTSIINSRSTNSILSMVGKYAICCTRITETTRYGYAASNTWAIGNILAYVNQAVIEISRQPKRIKTFCIGHSLGAHLCGFFGKMVKILQPKYPLNKIIGLDPAGPIFQWKDSKNFQDPTLRLNKADAKKVEIFHTSEHLGFKDPLGDIDFYINGGTSQPGCNWLDNKIGICSHKFAHRLFITLNKKEESCTANWKCKIAKVSRLHPIENEDVSKLEAAGCSYQAGVTLGSLDQISSNNVGVYWVDVDRASKTCKKS